MSLQSDDMRLPGGQELEQMSVEALAKRCVAENERYRHQQPYDARYAHELFRRALVLRDEGAWAQIYQIYSPLVERWVQRNSGFARTGETSEFLVNASFIRFWRAITPDRFASFPTPGALLRYLHCCTTGAVIDLGRSQPWDEMLPEAALEYAPDEATPHEDAVERIAHAEFWRDIAAKLRSDAERVVLYCLFALEMRPREIFERYRRLFATVDEIYSTRRLVIKRLRSQDDLLGSLV